MNILNNPKILLMLAGLSVAGIIIFSQNQPGRTTPPDGNVDTAQNNTHTDNSVDEGGPGEAEPPHPVSIAALAAKNFDGRDFTIGQVLTNEATYTRYFITYKSGDLTISGIMNVPKGEPPIGGFPVLFLNHGYIDPAVYTNGRGLRREQDYLARRGYVVVHSDYRNHAQSSKDPNTEYNLRLGYAEDVINGILAIQNSGLPYVNKEKIGMLGHSMGGGVTMNILVARPNLVDAAVLFAPVSADARDNFNRWTRTRPETAQRIIQDYGSPQDNPEFWDNVSPITFLGRITTPILLHHGTADDSVPISWSDKLNAALTQKNKQITYHIYPGEPHEFAAAWPMVMQRTVEFFDKYLK